MTAEFFILDASPDPWGDYGRILMHGMTAHLGRNADGLLQLERCGPFVPPISLPGVGDIVVTDSFRNELEKSSLTGFEFRAVAKVRIVNNLWHDGSRDSEEPPKYPRSGEPEDYILRFPHHRGIAKQIGEMWEVVPKEVCYTTRKSHIVKDRSEITLVTEDWDGADVFRAEGVRYNFVSLKARDWFLARVPELLVFGSAVTSPTKRDGQQRI